MNLRSFLLSSLIAGVAMGIIANTPVLSWTNLCCGIWYWVGSIAAVWLYQRLDNENAEITDGLGSILGLVSVIIGMVTAGVLAILIAGTVGFASQWVEMLPPEFLESPITGIFMTGIGQALGPSCLIAPMAGPTGGWIGVQIFVKSKNLAKLD